MFLLIYNIIREASAAQVFSTLFPAATVIFQIIPIILLALTYQPSHYKPYQPKAKWRKELKAHCRVATAKISSSASNVAEWISTKMEDQFGKMRRARRQLTPSFTRRHQLYYWTTYNYKRRHALQARWRCFWAIYSITAARTAHSYQCCASTKVPSDRAPAKQVSFDSDSFDIMVDNCCSYSITNDLDDYVSPPSMAHVQVKGYAGATSEANKVGTVRWQVEDDAGTVHDLLLPGTYYSPSAEHRMLSPQHWCQVANDHQPTRNGTVCITQADAVILQWQQRQYTRTIPLTPRTNVGVLRSAPGISKYNACCALCEGEPTLAYPSTMELPVAIVSDDEEPQVYEPTPAATAKKADRFQRLKQQLADLRATRQQPTAQESADENDAELAKVQHLSLGHMGADALDELQVQRNMDFSLNEEPMEEEEPLFDDLMLEYQYYHLKLNHAPKSKMLQAIKNGMLPSRLAKIKKPPPCPACITSKATRTPWRTKAAYRGIIETTEPGECTSVDQLESPTPGFMGLLKGQPTKRRYKAATVFKDHFSKAKYVHYQENLTGDETLKAKHAYERWASSNGVKIKRYHGDNGRFGENIFKDDCIKQGQRFSYCPANQHNQNGHAEKAIRDLQDSARSMLQHAQRQWPSAITTNLWPYAMNMAADLHNHLPRAGSDSTPLEIVTGSKIAPSMRHFHHFGCPVYVLNSKLANGKKAAKWEDRTRVAIYLGKSQNHARSVSLVLSLTTGMVSPQYHCKFDDLFQTVSGKGVQQVPVSKWQQKAFFVSDPEVAARVINQPEQTVLTPALEQAEPTFPPPQQPPSAPQNAQPKSTATATRAPKPIKPRAETPAEAQQKPAQQTRSGRTVKAPMHHGEFVAYQAVILWEDEDNEHPLKAFKASADPDTMYLHEAMREPDKKEFMAAMEKEMADHMQHWELVLRSCVPEGVKVFQSVWQMKRKRRIQTQEVYKHKARINFNGSTMVQGEHYDESYAPVVTWPATRYFLAQSILHGWHTKQMDFVLAYTQAEVDRSDLYMEIPRGVTLDGADSSLYVLHLKQNLYGMKQAGRVWNKHLVGGLVKLGFKQSSVDECVLYFDKSVLLVYTDDTILMGPDESELNHIVTLLQSKFDLEVEGTLCDYLGINITKTGSGALELTQPHLIQSILEDLGLNRDGTTPKHTPALSSKILGKDQHEPPHSEETFQYRSVIGKLNYLEKSTRPDIAYAVHQCARFSSDPRSSHTKAVKRIGRYLLATADKGIILQPNSTSFECWVDASHAGEWNKETAPVDQATAKSRSGYAITLGGCPILWASKMQTEIALSSTEAEYIAMSQAMREVLPMMALMQEAAEAGVLPAAEVPKVHCKVFEDNSGAIEIARLPKMRPRTKHLNIKYHHFRDQVARGRITIHFVPTEDQIADMLTKPVPIELLTRFRGRLMGW